MRRTDQRSGHCRGKAQRKAAYDPVGTHPIYGLRSLAYGEAAALPRSDFTLCDQLPLSRVGGMIWKRHYGFFALISAFPFLLATVLAVGKAHPQPFGCAKPSQIMVIFFLFPRLAFVSSSFFSLFFVPLAKIFLPSFF